MRKIQSDSFIGTHYIGKEEEEAVVEVIRSKSLFRYDGLQLLKKTEEFENRLKSYLGVDNVLACSSGAAALKLCCIALGIGPGDEVLMSPFTFIASAAAVLSCGAIPNFVDVDESMNINPKLIEAMITPRTKAIMVIHIQGVPCDMDPILNIAKKHNLYVIEDAAQAFGAEYDGKSVGTLGDAAAFSLQANKIITCGEGGIFICKLKANFEKARHYHDNGGKRIGYSYPVWDDPECSYGENFKITEIQSAIAMAQLQKVDMIIKKQKDIFAKLTKGVNTNRFRLRPVPDKANPIPVSLCYIFDTNAQCMEFIDRCNQNGIPMEIYCDKVLTSYTTFREKKSWHPCGVPYHYFENYTFNKCAFTEEISLRSAWLSISPGLNDEDIEYINSVLSKL